MRFNYYRQQVQLLSYFVQCVITVLLFGITYYLTSILLKEKISIKVLKDLNAKQDSIRKEKPEWLVYCFNVDFFMKG